MFRSNLIGQKQNNFVSSENLFLNAKKSNLFESHENITIEEILKKVETLYENIENSNDSKFLTDIFLINKLCFNNECLYQLFTPHYQEKVKELLASNFVFFNLFVGNKTNPKNSEVLYELIFKDEFVLLKHFKSVLRTQYEKKQLLTSLKTLYFGSRIFNRLLELPQVNIYNFISRLSTLYFILCNKEIDEPSVLGDFLLSSIKLNPFMVMEEFFLQSEDNPQSFLSTKTYFNEIFINKVYKPSNTIIKKKIILEVSKFLAKLATKDSYSMIFYIIQKMNPVYLDFEKLLAYCNNEIFIFSYIKACSVSHCKRLLNILMIKWVNTGTSTKITFATNDLLITKLILICCQKLEEEEPLLTLEAQFANSSTFLNGISKRLVNPLPMFVERTMIVANRITNNKVKYDVNLKLDYFYEAIDIDKEFVNLRLEYQPKEYKKNDELANVEQEIKILTIKNSEPLTDNVTKRIYFIKDFLKHLLSVSSDSTNLLNPTEVLVEGFKLMELKLKNKNVKEIQFYIDELLPVLINLKDTRDKELLLNLETYKIKCIVCLIKAQPSKTLDLLLETLFYKEISFQSRLAILTCISVGCLGIRDDILDENISSLFKSKEENNGLLVYENLIKETQTTWRSRKLDIIKKESSQKTRSLKSEYTMTIVKVCYSMVAGWLRGIDLGNTLDTIFKKHYLKCLSLIYSLISGYKHLDPNKDLESGVKEVLVDAFNQNIMLDKESLGDTELM
ncbi:hypothetical protein QEN19_000042 [Hanseniaspora menglaensis]